jgi:hypothetical protein
MTDNSKGVWKTIERHKARQRILNEEREEGMNQIVERENTAVVEATLPSQATTLLQAITAAAANKDVDIQKMRELFEMHKEMVRIEAEAAFNAAMARAQAKIEPVATNAFNTQTQSWYAKLAAVAKKITPIYAAEGLSVSFDEGKSDKGPEWFRTLAKVSHSAGHTRDYHLDLPFDDVGAKGTVNKTRVHATGSTNTYGRRYLLCMIFNVATEDDTDGNTKDDQGRMPERDYADHMTAIDGAGDETQCKNAWKVAAAACHKYGDKEAHAVLKEKTTARLQALRASKKAKAAP